MKCGIPSAIKEHNNIYFYNLILRVEVHKLQGKYHGCNKSKTHNMVRNILSCTIHHFTVVGLVTRPLNGSEAGVDLVLIQTSLLYCANQVVLMLTSWHLHEKSREVCIKARSPSASLAFMASN